MNTRTTTLLIGIIIALALAAPALAETQAAPVGTPAQQATKEDILRLQLENINLRFQLNGCQALVQQAASIQEQLKSAQPPAPQPDKPAKKK